jgi:hypothetical protein
MAEVLVDQFEGSGTYDSVRDNLKRLRDDPDEAWTADLLQRIEGAADKNDQIADAHVGYGPFKKSVPAEAKAFAEQRRSKLAAS